MLLSLYQSNIKQERRDIGVSMGKFGTGFGKVADANPS